MPSIGRLFSGRTTAPLPYPPTSAEGLAARWVQWAASSPIARNPISDKTGKWAAANQPDDVWFLAGTFGGPAERQCAVPAGRPLFLPAFNMWEWPSRTPTAVPSAYGNLTVDGVPTELDVIGTPEPFQVKGALLNPVTRMPRGINVTVWGIWRRLDPLAPGEHVVEFDGGDGYGFTVGPVIYRLTVG
jgi:hypothetical protein